MDGNDLSDVISRIVARAPQLPVSRIILFGSSATGSRDDDSDVDLAVVVNQPPVFETYDQRLEAKSLIRASMRDINRIVPIDLLLFTEAEYNERAQAGGFLSTEVTTRGLTIYERAS